MNKKEIIFIISLFIISFLLRFLLAFLSPIKYWDETIYANLGRNLIIHKNYTFLNFGDFFPNWPLAGARPPLLPFIISIVFLISKNSFWLNIIGPFFSSIGILALFFFSRRLFNDKIAFYSSIIFAFFPSNLFWSSKLLTDGILLTFLIIGSHLFFSAFVLPYKKKTILAMMSGIIFGLAFLTRYTALWFFIMLGIWFIFVKRNLKFLYQKEFLSLIIGFIIIVLPWFIFNTYQFGAPLEFLKNSSEASIRWGGKSIFYYLKTLSKNFLSLIPLLFLGLFSFKKIKFERYSKSFITLWLFLIFIFASLTTAKENRYLLPILPAFSIISASGIYYLERFKKAYKILALIILTLFLLFSTSQIIIKSHKNYLNTNTCFFASMEQIKNSGAKNVVTEHFSPVYYYTLVPTIRINNYTELKSQINSDGETLYFYVEGDWFNLKSETNTLKIIYKCEQYEIHKFI